MKKLIVISTLDMHFSVYLKVLLDLRGGKNLTKKSCTHQCLKQEKLFFHTYFPSSRRGFLMYGKCFSIQPGSSVYARCSSVWQTILYLNYNAATDTVFALSVLLSFRRVVAKAFRPRAVKLGGNLQLQDFLFLTPLMVTYGLFKQSLPYLVGWVFS